MPARPQSPFEDRPVNNLGRGDQVAIQTYLAVTDDGEIARIAAMMTPKGEVFDARGQVAQAIALQAEVTSELVRRREAIASSMSYAALLELGRHFGFPEVVGWVETLAICNDERLYDDPLTGPVLRRLVERVRAMPPPQDFRDQFLAEDPTTALELAASRTALRRPLRDATFQEALRYAANISTDVVSWDILYGAFFDFFRIWFLYPPLPMELFPADAGAVLTKAKFSKLIANLKRHQQELASFHDAFTPGKEFPPGIDELAHRAYAECWENGLSGPLWRRRLAWLVDEFTPFWHRHEAAYLAIHQVRVKAEADAAAVIQADQLKKSAKAQAAGEVGRQSREGDRWRSVTAEFLKFLMSSSCGTAPADLQDCVTTFVSSSPTLGGKQIKAKTLEVLQTLCTAVSSNLDASSVLKCLQRSKYSKIQALEPKDREKQLAKLSQSEKKESESTGATPYDWIQYKALTEDAVSDCLEDLKVALSELRTKKVKK